MLMFEFAVEGCVVVVVIEAQGGAHGDQGGKLIVICGVRYLGYCDLLDLDMWE